MIKSGKMKKMFLCVAIGCLLGPSLGSQTRSVAHAASNYDSDCRACVEMYCHLECGGVLGTCGQCIQEHCSFQC